MRCSDLQSNLSFYADGFLSDPQSVGIKMHLGECPLCRQRLDEYRELRTALRRLSRPKIGAALQTSLAEAVRTEIRFEKQSRVPVSRDIREWFQMRVMPYGVGVFASLFIGFTFISMLYSGMLRPARMSAPAANDTSVMLASNSSHLGKGDAEVLSPSEYAKTRLEFASDSPSVNPNGALIALTKSFVRGGMKDDEVVVVADVFSNGLAQIAEVVEPSRDSRAVGELQKALDSDPTFAPFVPSSMESRPDSVRVVLKFQSVDVNTGTKPRKHR